MSDGKLKKGSLVNKTVTPQSQIMLLSEELSFPLGRFRQQIRWWRCVELWFSPGRDSFSDLPRNDRFTSVHRGLGLE